MLYYSTTMCVFCFVLINLKYKKYKTSEKLKLISRV